MKTNAFFSIVCGGGLRDVCRLHGQAKSTIGCCFGKGDSFGSTESGSNGRHACSRGAGYGDFGRQSVSTAVDGAGTGGSGYSFRPSSFCGFAFHAYGI